MPERELEICRRVRAFRQQKHLSQVAFAQALSIDTTTLGNIEHSRSPLRYGIAATMCRAFNINMQWLATGKPPMSQFIEIAPSLEETISPRSLFSEAYTTVLDSYVEHRLEELGQLLGRPVEEIDDLIDVDTGIPVGTSVEDSIIFYLVQLLSLNIRTMPESLQREFSLVILSTTDKFIKRHGLEIKHFHESRRLHELRLRITKQFPLPPVTEQRKSSGVSAVKAKSELDSLLERVTPFTSAPGAKSALAASLGVPLPRVSEWLNRRIAPSAETVLRILRWVEGKERETKNPESVDALPGQKTRTESIKHEKHPSSRKKP